MVVESIDGKALLVGECKWTNPEIASEIYKKLMDKVSHFPYSKGKEIAKRIIYQKVYNVKIEKSPCKKKFCRAIF